MYNLENVVKQFNVSSGLISSICPYGNGHINDTFYFSVGDEKYLLQKINKNIFPNVEALMHNIEQVTLFLQNKISSIHGDKNRETLQIIYSKQHKSYYLDEEKNAWRIYRFIDNTLSLELPESIEDFRQSGVAFGNFQFLLSNFPSEHLYETIPNFHNTVDRLNQFKIALEKDQFNRAKGIKKECQFILDREEDCKFFINLLNHNEIPLRVCHNDTKLNNVLLDKTTRKAICVIDLDTVMPGLAAYDFGDAIRFGASTAKEDEKNLNNVSLDLEMFKNFFEGYMEGCKYSLNKREVETLPMGAKIMTLECGMRFLTDYLNGDNYFKINYETHNLIRARTQFKLVKDMEEKWNEIEKIVQSN